MNTEKIIKYLFNSLIIFSIIFTFLMIILLIFNTLINPYLILTIWLFGFYYYIITVGLLIICGLINKKK